MKFGLLTFFDYYPEDCAAQDYYRFLLDEITPRSHLQASINDQERQTAQPHETEGGHE